MRKIIPLRSLLGYALVVFVCTVSVAVNWNLILAAGKCDGFSFSHVTQNAFVDIKSALSGLAQMAGFMLIGSLCVSAIFLSTIVATVIEVHSSNLARLSLIGASKAQIIRFFLFAVAKPMLIAIFLGTVLGGFFSRPVAWVYFLAGSGASNFMPQYHLLTLEYTFLVMLGIFIVAVLVCLKKLLAVNPLRISTGKHKDLSRISVIRLLLGIAVFIFCVFFYFTADMTNGDRASNNSLLLGLTLLVSFYLLVPGILKGIMPAVFLLFTRIFPITGMLAKRYFHAHLRKFTSFTAPIIVSLMFICVWYMLVITGREATKEQALLRNNVTAVAVDIPAHNPQLLHQYLDLYSIGVDGLATPKRVDDRWAETGNFEENPEIVEVAPGILPKIWKKLFLSGNMALVHGTNIASSRESDALGSTVSLIAPSGKTIRAHIVAKLAQSDVIGTDVFVADYKSFPESGTSSDPYSIYYSGVSVQSLRSHGIHVISYKSFLNQKLHSMFHGQNLGMLVMIYPILLMCLALVIVNSSTIGSQSGFIRRVTAILGGSIWQDIRIALLQLFTVFLIAMVFTLGAGVIVKEFFTRFLQHDHWDISVYFPYKELGIALSILVLAAITPLIIKTINLSLEQKK